MEKKLNYFEESNKFPLYPLTQYELLYLVKIPGVLDGKESACQWEMQVQSLGLEDPLEEEMATHSSILAWQSPWTEEQSGVQSIGWQRVRHDWMTNTFFLFKLYFKHHLSHLKMLKQCFLWNYLAFKHSIVTLLWDITLYLIL